MSQGCVSLMPIHSLSYMYSGLKITDSRLPIMMTGQIFFSPDKPRFWLVKK